MPPKYTGNIQKALIAPPKKKEGLTKNNTTQWAHIQSTNSTIKKKPKTINNLDRAQWLQRKANLILWSESSLLLNAPLLLSFQTVQKRYKGATHQTFFLFLPIKDPCQLECILSNWRGRRLRGGRCLIDATCAKRKKKRMFIFLWIWHGYYLVCESAPVQMLTIFIVVISEIANRVIYWNPYQKKRE